MFSLNEKVLVSNVGVCEIRDILIQNFGDGEKKYYILFPVYKDKADKIMIPIDFSQKIRALSDIDCVKKGIAEFDSYEDFWLKDPRQRKESFFTILNSGDFNNLRSLYLTIQYKKQELVANKKTLNSTDKSILDIVTKVLCEEIATVLGIDYSSVLDTLTSKFKVVR